MRRHVYGQRLRSGTSRFRRHTPLMNAVNEWRVSHRNENVVPVLRAHGAELALEAAEAATLLCTPASSLPLPPARSLPLPPAPSRRVQSNRNTNNKQTNR